jgi:DNA polymerase-3 subunit gamma/tau
MPDAPSRNGADNARYLVTARKYRPVLFRELAAQGHVTDTLKNALRTGRLAHAYLFSGPRGVGKTTAARILAKAINCTTQREEREDDAEPCRQCESCRSFEEGRSLGIFELDAASNNKVDDIRELRETVRVPPQGARKKVYIIDEVHMLSNSAFNALLKTLEEPPPHVLFIFATTEPHKVLPTILSRCQRFDFRRIPAGRIAEHLRWICQKEDIEADDGSLMLLARKGDGALRDALSAFDQAVSLCGDVLHYDELAQALGVVDADLYFDATEYIREGASAGMLRLVENVVASGYDLQEFLSGLSEHLRNLMVVGTMEDTALIEATDAMRRRYAQSARHFSEDDLLRLLMVAGEAEDAVKQSTQPRLRLEMALLKMAALPRAADLQETLTTLRRLEKMAHDGALADLPSRAPASESSDPPDAQRQETQTQEAANPDAAKAAAANAVSTPEPDAEPDAEPDVEPDDPQPEASTQTTYATPETGNAADRVHEPSSPASEASEAGDPEAEAEKTDEEKTGDAPSVLADEDDPEAASNTETEAGSSGGDASRGGSPGKDESPAPPEYNDLFGPPALSAQTKPSDGDSASQNSAPQNTAGGGAATAIAPAAEQVAPGAADHSPVVERLRSHWDALVKSVHADRIDLASCLGDAMPISLSAGTLTVSVPNQFSRRFLLDQESFLLNHVEKHLPERTTVPSALRLTLQEPSDEGTSDDAPTDPHDVMKQLREEHPVVKAIFEEFGGEMAW